MYYEKNISKMTMLFGMIYNKEKQINDIKIFEFLKIIP